MQPDALLDDVTRLIDRESIGIAVFVALALEHTFNPVLLFVALIAVTVFIMAIRTVLSYWKEDTPSGHLGIFRIIDNNMQIVALFDITLLTNVIVRQANFGVDNNKLGITFLLLILASMLAHTMVQGIATYRMVRNSDVASLEEIASTHPSASEKVWLETWRHAISRPAK